MSPMRHAFGKSATTLMAVVLALVVFFSLRWLLMAGAFTMAPSPTLDQCRAIPGLQGPEDFEADAGHDTIIVSSPEVPNPEAARYAWQSFPNATLYNGANLPAVPFRTDEWEKPNQK